MNNSCNGCGECESCMLAMYNSVKNMCEHYADFDDCVFCGPHANCEMVVAKCEHCKNVFGKTWHDTTENICLITHLVFTNISDTLLSKQ